MLFRRESAVLARSSARSPAMLALPTLLSTLQGAALLAGRAPPVRCSLASSGEAFLVPDASVPCLIFEDDQIAIVAKPAGKHISILDWASDGNVARSTADGALDPPIPLTPLSGVVGGLVPLAKTAAAAACLRAEAASTRCEYAAIVTGAPPDHGGASCGRLGLTWLETSPCRPRTGKGFAHARALSLVTISTEADLGCEEVCSSFDETKLGVVGANEVVPGQKVRARREARRQTDAAATVGGVHLALVGLELPAALAALQSAGAPSGFRIAPPKRFGKLMKSERIEAARLAAKDDAAAARKEARAGGPVAAAVRAARAADADS